jgi:hypothetical protein
MPKASTPNAAKPQPKATKPTTAPKAGTTIDLAKYPRVGAPGAPAAKNATPDESAQRAARPRVKFEELAGIAGLVMSDAFEDVNDTYGPYVGATVTFPDGAEALVLTSASTRAGKSVRAKVDSGAFDAEGVKLPFTATARPSPNHPEGRPMIIVRFGGSD